MVTIATAPGETKEEGKRPRSMGDGWKKGRGERERERVSEEGRKEETRTAFTYSTQLKGED